MRRFLGNVLFLLKDCYLVLSHSKLVVVGGEGEKERRKYKEKQKPLRHTILHEFRYAPEQHTRLGYVPG